MFSSNQVLSVSGSFKQLEDSIEFAFKLYTSNTDGKEVYYQITEDGRYCIGWSDGNGWEKFPFKYDASIMAKIIEQHINSVGKVEYGGYDGTYRLGFKMDIIESTFADEDNGIKKPFYGIVSFEPFTNFYAK